MHHCATNNLDPMLLELGNSRDKSTRHLFTSLAGQGHSYKDPSRLIDNNKHDLGTVVARDFESPFDIDVDLGTRSDCDIANRLFPNWTFALFCLRTHHTRWYGLGGQAFDVNAARARDLQTSCQVGMSQLAVEQQDVFHTRLARRNGHWPRQRLLLARRVVD